MTYETSHIFDVRNLLIVKKVLLSRNDLATAPGIQKLDRSDICLNEFGRYVEK